MKRYSFYSYFIGLFVVAGVFYACNKEPQAINLALTASKALSAPAEGASVVLAPATNASVVFEWQQATAADGALVLYEVAFDKDGGDFSNPIYKIASDNSGIQKKATLSHGLLNKIAGLAGIQSLSTGKLRWTVLASKGTNVVKSDQARVVSLTRPAGFAEIPGDVFLTGDATEAGTDLSKAIKLRQIGNGEFEVITSLKAGTYRFVDRLTGTTSSFSVTGALLREGGTTTVTGAAKPYRIVLDFNNSAAKLQEIKEVGLWYCIDNDIRFTLSYSGNSTFEALNKKIDFPSVPWGVEERYKFRMTVNDGTKEETLWYGSRNADNQRPDGSTPPAYFQLLSIGASQWDFSYKFPLSVNGKNNDVIVFFRPNVPFSHEVKTR
jgi:starch-binding outer membrane protein SusE/F